MSQGRHSVFGALIVVIATILLTVGFVVAALLVGPDIQALLVRMVLVTLIIFLVILFLRYFTLLWFAYLGHAERNVLGVKKHHEMPAISVLVPAYNEGELMERALASLLELDYPEFEVVVIDDGSTDDTLERAVRWEGRRGPVEVKVVTKRNGGKATALNAGIAASKHPFILCMDADSYLHPKTLLRAIEHFGDPSVGAVAGNVKVENRGKIITRLQALEYIEGLNMPRRAQGFVAAVNTLVASLSLVLYFTLIPSYGALGAAIATTTTVIVYNVLNQVGLVMGTGIGRFRGIHVRIYVAVAMVSTILLGVRMVTSSVWILLPLIVISGFGLLRWSRDLLAIADTFPELTRIPGFRLILGGRRDGA